MIDRERRGESFFRTRVAMTNGDPGRSTWVPAHFTVNALFQKQNLGYASADAVMMLLITAAVFLPLAGLMAWQQRGKRAAR